MKNLKYIILTSLIFIGVVCAEDRIASHSIIDKIKNGITITYENIIVVGDLDFTQLYDKKAILQEEEKSLAEKITSYFIDFNISGNKTIQCNVEVPVEFIGCTFQGQVIGWINDEKNGISYNAIFHDKAKFSKCIFKEEVLFKYSEFNGKVDFSENNYKKAVLFKYTNFSSSVNFEGSVFTHEANFKYTTFLKETTFIGSQFKRNANFKYTDFDDSVDFSNTSFNEGANFKYTKFPKGVSFKNSVFSALSNFKYTEFSNPLNLAGTLFKGDTDFKYTTLDGEEFINPISQ